MVVSYNEKNECTKKKLNETSLCLSQSSPTGSHTRRGRLRQNCMCIDFFSFAFESPRSFSLFKISLLQKSLKASLDFCDFSSYFRKYSSADVSLSLSLSLYKTGIRKIRNRKRHSRVHQERVR